MTDRNDYERNYYIDRNGNRIPYDPETVQPPIVYGEAPFTDSDLNELEEIDPDGFIIHESHGEYERYPGDEAHPSPMARMIGPDWDNVEVDHPIFDKILTEKDVNGYDRDISETALYQSDLLPENGKFHIRYYGVVEHSQFAPCDPTRTDGVRHSGLVSLAVRGMGDNHLHTDLHTFNPLSLLAEGNCPPGSKVRVDIQDFENVILEYIYNYPRQLMVKDYTDDPDRFAHDTFVELGQWDGNKKMRLSDFFVVIAEHFHTSLGNLYATLRQYDKDHTWIEGVPTQYGMSLLPTDGVTLPYSHLPKPFVKGDFEYNPATRISTLMLDYVDYIRVPPKTEPRVYQMQGPQILKAGTIPSNMCPKEPMRLTSYADISIRSGDSEIVDEDRDAIDLLIRTDGSVWVDGSIWLQHHEVGQPNVKLNDRWRIEISSKGGAILL